MFSNEIACVELPATSTDHMKAFDGSLFSRSLQDWGADYATLESMMVSTPEMNTVRKCPL